MACLRMTLFLDKINLHLMYYNPNYVCLSDLEDTAMQKERETHKQRVITT